MWSEKVKLIDSLHNLRASIDTYLFGDIPDDNLAYLASMLDDDMYEVIQSIDRYKKARESV